MPNEDIASPPTPTPPGIPGNQVPQPNFDTLPMGGASGPNTGNVLRTQLEQPGGIRPGGGVRVNVENNSELQKHLGINQVGNTQQGLGGESLFLKQLGKQTTSDPTPDMINQVAPSLANKIPNDSLHPIHPHNQKQPEGYKKYYVCSDNEVDESSEEDKPKNDYKNFLQESTSESDSDFSLSNDGTISESEVDELVEDMKKHGEGYKKDYELNEWINEVDESSEEDK